MVYVATYKTSEVVSFDMNSPFFTRNLNPSEYTGAEFTEFQLICQTPDRVQSMAVSDEYIAVAYS